jgi:quercetin dioxygenase-like cupin family protein
MKIVQKHTEVEPQMPEGEGVRIHWVIDKPDGAPNFAMRVIEVDPGCNTPYHTHAHEHEVFIVSGKAIVASKDGKTPIQAGSAVFVAPHEEHNFTNDGDEVLKLICVVPHYK